jgi:hypothetical protein
MESNLRKIWIKIALILLISVCLAFIVENTKATSNKLDIQLNDSSIVYYSYDSGELNQTIVLNNDQDTATIQKPDILIIGEILDSKEFSKTTIDTLKDNWFNQTNYQSYTYTVQVNSVEFGSCSKNYLEIMVTSSSSHRFRYSHISENGDSIYEAIILEPFCCGHLINKQIPVGEDCIFHFKKGDLGVVDYISSYSSDNLKKYMKNSDLETEHLKNKLH